MSEKEKGNDERVIFFLEERKVLAKRWLVRWKLDELIRIVNFFSILEFQQTI
jgi:hypothetical protein